MVAINRDLQKPESFTSKNWATKYQIVKHAFGYAGSEKKIIGFAEAVEILNPILGIYNSYIHIFWEGYGSKVFAFSSVPEGIDAFIETCHLFRSNKTRSEIVKTISAQPGFIYSGYNEIKAFFYQ